MNLLHEKYDSESCTALVSVDINGKKNLWYVVGSILKYQLKSSTAPIYWVVSYVLLPESEANLLTKTEARNSITYHSNRLPEHKRERKDFENAIATLYDGEPYLVLGIDRPPTRVRPEADELSQSNRLWARFLHEKLISASVSG